MPLIIIRNDITKVKADAIVNTANPHPRYDAGTDQAIYMAAGADELLHARQQIGEIERGGVAVTPAFALRAKYIIHTVGPSWIDGEYQEREILRSCYRNSLYKALELECKSVAFPLISTGIYGFPKKEALQLAVSEIKAFLEQEEMNVTLVVFGREEYELSGSLFSKIDAYIDERYVREQSAIEYSFGASLFEENMPRRTQATEREYSVPDMSATEDLEEYSVSDMSEKLCCQESLSDRIKHLGETFQERLFRMIEARGLTDAQVYKRANIDRKLFSKIRCSTEYTPKKKTVLALALALELCMDDTKDLLASAGYAFSPSSRFDLIIQYFIENEVYDVHAINIALFEHDEPILGE